MSPFSRRIQQSIRATSGAANQAPSAPSNLVITPAQTSLALSWTAATDSDGTIASYQVRVNGVLDGSTASTTYNVTGLTANTAYTITVRAVDNLGLSGPDVTGNGTTSAAGAITHGRQVDGTNTGIAGVGLVSGDLTLVSGSVTYSTNGQIVEMKRFTGQVTLAGSNITFRKCLISTPGGLNNKSLVNTGSNNLIEDVTIAPSSGSLYMCVDYSSGTNLVVRRLNASGGENILTCGSDSLTLDSSWLHDTSLISQPVGHADVVEVYYGAGNIITKCKLEQTFGLGDAPINVAPWGNVDYDMIGLDITDCYLSGGNSHVLVDNQTLGTIQNIRVLRCDMDGHTDNGIYSAFQDNDGRGTVTTAAAQTANPEAVLWPESGADRSLWVDCSDLTPDRTGEVIFP